MMDNTFGGGANSAALQKLMQQKMLEEMFGLKASERPILAAAAPVGTDPNGSWGVMGMRLFSATMTSPIPRLEFETNGKLLVHPDEIDVLVKFLQQHADEFRQEYEKAVLAAKDMEGAEMFATALGVDTKTVVADGTKGMARG